MKKRLLFISLALALTVLTSCVALAGEDKHPASFEAYGEITGITPGTVYPIDNGWWRVAERQISGTMSGDISGNFTLTYKGKFLLATQEGTLTGNLVTDDGACVLKVKGESQPLEYVSRETPSGTFLFPKLTINGTWHFNKVAGSGDFTTWIIFVPTPQGHVDYIVDSAFTMTGTWKVEADADYN